MVLTIRGDSRYEKKMFTHLRKEHPSTRNKMKLVEKVCSNKSSKVPREIRW